jgi:hypothetical protein
MSDGKWEPSSEGKQFSFGDWALVVSAEDPTKMQVRPPKCPKGGFWRDFFIDVEIKDDGLNVISDQCDGYHFEPKWVTIPWPILEEIMKFRSHGLGDE